MSVTDEKHVTAIRDLLAAIGEDPHREGLEDTPYRFLRALEFHTSGYRTRPEDVLKTFEDGASSVDEMVFQGNVQFASHCEHHLAPFFGVVHLAYVPNNRIVGLSKISRLVEVFARRLQVQERLCNDIAAAFNDLVQPLGVGVVIQARHLCMESRGVQKVGTVTATSALRGCFREQPECRAEFYALVNSQKSSI